MHNRPSRLTLAGLTLTSLLLGACADDPVLARHAAALASTCSARGQSTAYEWIATVGIAGRTTASGNNGGYLRVDEPVVVGPSFDLTLTPGFRSGAYGEYWRAWLDTDHDGLLEDSEVVLSASGSSTITRTISVPSGAADGDTTLRIAMRYGGYPSACGTFANGEVEDYVLVLPAGLDDVPPVLESRTPAAEATMVAVAGVVTARLSEPIDPASLDATSLTLAEAASGAPVAGTVEATSDPREVRFRASAPLSYSTLYEAALAADVTDAAGNPLGSAVRWTFETEPDPATVPLRIVRQSPAPGAGEVAVTSSLYVRFDHPLDGTTIVPEHFALRAGAVDVPFTVVPVWPDGATLVPAAPLARGTTYTLTVGTGLRDTRGLGLAEPISWSFTTVQHCVSQAGEWSTRPWMATLRIDSRTFSATRPQVSYFLDPTPIVRPLIWGSLSAQMRADDSGWYDPRVLWRAWVDWNRDGEFAADEVAFSRAGTGLQSATITPPPGQTAGKVRLRVAMKSGGTYPDVYPTPCGIGESAGVVDFDVDLK
jgi:hypothetical protein